MAISTYKVFLMKGTTSGSSTTYEKLVDIKDFPDLGGAPEMLETTTLRMGRRPTFPVFSRRKHSNLPQTTPRMILIPSKLLKELRSISPFGLAVLFRAVWQLRPALTVSSSSAVSCPCSLSAAA